MVPNVVEYMLHNIYLSNYFLECSKKKRERNEKHGSKLYHFQVLPLMFYNVKYVLKLNFKLKTKNGNICFIFFENRKHAQQNKYTITGLFIK